MLVLNDGYAYVKIPGLYFRSVFICPFRLITGHNCPFCGMTRCFASLGCGDFASAFAFNKAGILVYVFCLSEVIRRSVRGRLEGHHNIIKSTDYAAKISFLLMLIVAIADWIITCI
ncbi:MAG: DUF2752 domain-containing protein [Clostridium sp.]|nr:DUF2752 domain-containing protein [Clostridium sp.]